MSDQQARRNVERMSQMYRDAAERMRKKIASQLTGRPLSDAERTEVLAKMEQLANLMEAKAKWWLTGGPLPQ